MLITSFKVVCGAVVGFNVGRLVNALINAIILSGCNIADKVIEKDVNAVAEEVTEE